MFGVLNYRLIYCIHTYAHTLWHTTYHRWGEHERWSHRSLPVEFLVGVSTRVWIDKMWPSPLLADFHVENSVALSYHAGLSRFPRQFREIERTEHDTLEIKREKSKALRRAGRIRKIPVSELGNNVAFWNGARYRASTTNAYTMHICRLHWIYTKTVGGLAVPSSEWLVSTYQRLNEISSGNNAIFDLPHRNIGQVSKGHIVNKISLSYIRAYLSFLLHYMILFIVNVIQPSLL